MVKYLVHWSEQSKIDLKGIFEYIKTVESKERALYVISGIRKAVDEITLFPYKHRGEPVVGDETIRYAVKWHYKILFTISEEYVNIVRVFHTSQSPEKIKNKL